MSAARTPLSAAGWVAGTWPAFEDEACPPVIVNPAAPVGAVLAWCYGELASLSATTTALMCSDADLSVDELSLIYRHRLEPVVRVMDAALGRLAMSQDPGVAYAPCGAERGAA